jgi:hypothetical protein
MHSDSFIAALLFEAEGAELDFKRDQYLFAGADDKAKSELLKDILAFANAWRRSDAYILIGIKEVKEGESKVVGITDHIDDANLQQFVSSKTNRPVEFSYTPMNFRGSQIGVIQIPVQDRPTFLMKDFGALRKNTVYLRRGSSTDEARPDEIARMGMVLAGNERRQPTLVPLLATGTGFSNFTQDACFETSRLVHPEIMELPDYRPALLEPFGHHILPLTFNNTDFYRERAYYLSFAAKQRPIRLAVRNDGTSIASGVKSVLKIEDPTHRVELVLSSDEPEVPRRQTSQFDYINSINKKIVTPDIELEKTNSGWTVVANFGKIQAKDMAVTSQKLFIGLDVSGKVEFQSLTFADELANPSTSALILSFVVTEQEITDEKLIR